MPRKPKLRPLSIFLIKEAITDYAAATRDPAQLAWVDLKPSIGFRGRLAVALSGSSRPAWADFLAPHLADLSAIDGLANSSTAALLFVQSKSRTLALAFGHGRHLLDPGAYEQEFGLRVVLNTVDPGRLRSVDARTIDELTIHTRRDVSRGSTFGVFGLDVTRELVRAVSGPPRDESLGERATGADALNLVTRAPITELSALGGRLVEAASSTDYRDRFGWIDNLRPIRDPIRIAALDAQLLDEF
jgi:uncharacterized protein (TIGR04141 family)